MKQLLSICSHSVESHKRYDVAEIFWQAYQRASLKAFEIWLVNGHAFGEDEYLFWSGADRVLTK